MRNANGFGGVVLAAAVALAAVAVWTVDASAAQKAAPQATPAPTPAEKAHPAVESAAAQNLGYEPSGDAFKGQPPQNNYTAGLLTGLGIIDSTAGFQIHGTIARKILNNGFVPEINNQVFIEAGFGPLFVSGGPAFFYTGNLRWDFPRDKDLTLYAIGGFAGHITGAELGNRWTFLPRFGVGAMYSLNAISSALMPEFSLRGEVSHEAILVGVSFAF